MPRARAPRAHGRSIGQYETVDSVERTVVAYEDGVPVLVRDVADVVETYKEMSSFVRSKGRPVLAINVQREVGSNVMQVMDGVRRAVADLNGPGGLLEAEKTDRAAGVAGVRAARLARCAAGHRRHPARGAAIGDRRLRGPRAWDGRARGLPAPDRGPHRHRGADRSARAGAARCGRR